MAINKNGQWIQNEFNERLLPDGYTQLEYIESTGEQYIDTNFVFDSQTSAFLEFSNASNSTAESGFIGAYQNSIGGLLFGIYKNSSEYYFRFAYGGPWNGNTVLADLNKHSITLNKNSINKLDNIVLATKLSITTSLNPNKTGYIFWTNGGTTYKGEFKLHKCKIWNNNILIRDFIPALRNSDNVAGLYDLVNNEFYTNAGTGTFIIGPKIGGTTANTKIYKETNILEANEFWEI